MKRSEIPKWPFDGRKLVVIRLLLEPRNEKFSKCLVSKLEI